MHVWSFGPPPPTLLPCSASTFSHSRSPVSCPSYNVLLISPLPHSVINPSPSSSCPLQLLLLNHHPSSLSNSSFVLHAKLFCLSPQVQRLCSIVSVSVLNGGSSSLPLTLFLLVQLILFSPLFHILALTPLPLYSSSSLLL